ncbi:hypothetical protein H2508_04515 [Parahaliea sp. F7430]|uniref:Esterase n=1 Tax=Sediminihaliea albiluteola TaxID=2758564 RepID=A0A7W2YJ87_9GAMM|nr:YqiA/YcfP family alpha/beta fold hydrolase [Sediminihaliea albiluteola]MBA6412369.1 hypothetical protein [Sediminihaliea albiluteola]
MNILYLHGYASNFDPSSVKVQALEKIGTVSGINIDYTEGPKVAIEAAKQACQEQCIDLVVGTSMGGWLASHCGQNCSIPFVALNPAVEPAKSLTKYIGQSIDYTGTAYTIDAETVASYPPFATEGLGLVICEEGDEVIDASATAAALKPHYDVLLVPGGSHRFESLDSQLELIQAHLRKATQGKA